VTGRRRAAAGPAVVPVEADLPRVTVRRGSIASTPLLTADDVDAVVLPIAPAAEGDEGVQPRTGTA